MLDWASLYLLEKLPHTIDAYLRANGRVLRGSGLRRLIERRQPFKQGESVIVEQPCGLFELLIDKRQIVELIDKQLKRPELDLRRELSQGRLRGVGKEIFLKLLLLPQPLLTPRDRLLKLYHLVCDDLALLQ